MVKTVEFNVVPGNYVVRLSKTGYIDKTFNITVNSDMELDYTNEVFELLKYLVSIKINDDVTLVVTNASGQTQTPESA